MGCSGYRSYCCETDGPSYAEASSLLNRSSSSDAVSVISLTRSGAAGTSSSSISPAAPSSRKKGTGFAPNAPSYHANKPHIKQSVNLSSTDGLLVVSVFLPIVLKRSDEGRWTAEWDYEMLLSMQTHLRVTRIGVVKWRGWHGNHGIVSEEGSPESGVPRAERHLVEACLRHPNFNCVPVWIDPLLFGEMYNGFCKGVLWPVLHNVTSVYTDRGEESENYVNRNNQDREMQFSEYSLDDVEQGPIHGGIGREAELWSAYNTVNRNFAEVVVQNFNEGDLVWVHGFHLLILPSYLTRRIPMAKVGIFLHTPFPSSEIFRTVWCREDLLRGMLNADQVGFHLFEYSRHFLTSCRRLLGLNYGMVPDASGGHTLALDTNGRHVAVTSIHAGVEPPVLNHILAHSMTMEKCATIRKRFEGMHICCAIDRLESLKGIPLKLLGFERFLVRCPEWAGKIVLIQVGISAFERGDDYFRTKNEVLKIVDKINNKWPGSVQFQECAESEMRLQQRMALLRASDTVIVTSIRDGLNLLPLEFTFAHQDALTEIGKKDRRKRGICILSEFSSCTRVMRGALHINPWKISEIASACYQAVTMSEEERLRRISIASEFVTRVTTQRWALAVMLDLKGVHKSIDPVQYSGYGLGLGYRLLGMHNGFSSLETNNVAKIYKHARARLILVDYGGTIVNNDNVRRQ
jgi:trehalose 6-phosphate synthase/phosphatase